MDIEDPVTIQPSIQQDFESSIDKSFEQDGYYIFPKILDGKACKKVASLYDCGTHFRKKVIMERHRFGIGEYQYFKKLPEYLETVREFLYEQLVAVANAWNSRLGIGYRYPQSLAAFSQELAESGQDLHSSLMIKYGSGCYNRLHQDLFGDLQFPFQVVILLSEPEKDFTGGEFILVENLPRQQSIPRSLSPQLGDAIVFPNRYRPIKSARGYFRATVRHGVSKVSSGERLTLGLVFHNAA